MLRLAPVLRQRFFDANGQPLAGGKVYSYVAETSTPHLTYSDADGLVPNTNPVILDSRGEADIFVGNLVYKFIVTDSNDVVQFTRDKVNANLTSAQDGIDGKSTITGTVDPGPSDGNDGDCYFNKTSKTFFGPKGESSPGVWPAGVSFKGDTGTAATVAVGTTTTGAAGSSASVTNSGNAAAAVLNFTIPKGDKGDPGANGVPFQEMLTGTYNSGTGLTTFTLTYTPTDPAEVLAFLGISWQFQGTHYSISGKTITFTGDVTGDQLFVHYRH